MVDTPSLTPQTPRALSGSVPVIRPDEIQLPNLRNIPSFSLRGLSEAEAAYSDMAAIARASGERIKATAEQIKREREAAQKAQDELILADVANKAQRRASEIEVDHFRDITGFDVKYKAYRDEVIKTLPERLRAEASIDLDKFGVSNASSILGRQRAKAEQEKNIIIRQSYENELDEIVLGIKNKDDLETMLPRAELLKQKVLSSTDTPEYRIGMMEEIEDRINNAVYLGDAKKLYDAGNFDLVMPFVMDKMAELEPDKPLDERLERAAEIVNDLAPLEKQRKAREAALEIDIDDTRKENFNQAIAQLGKSLANPDEPFLTLEQINAGDYRGQDRMALISLATMDNGIITSPGVLEDYNKLRREDPEAAQEVLTSALHTSPPGISKDDYISYSAKLDNSLIARPAINVEIDVLEDALTEATLSEDPTLASKTADAVTELQARDAEIAASLEGGRDNAQYEHKLRQARKEVQEEYGLISTRDLRLNLPKPYQYKGTPSDITVQSITQAAKKLKEDFESGEIPRSRREREQKKLKEWLTLIERERELGNE